MHTWASLFPSSPESTQLYPVPLGTTDTVGFSVICSYVTAGKLTPGDKPGRTLLNSTLVLVWLPRFCSMGLLLPRSGCLQFVQLFENKQMQYVKHFQARFKQNAFIKHNAPAAVIRGHRGNVKSTWTIEKETKPLLTSTCAWGCVLNIQNNIHNTKGQVFSLLTKATWNNYFITQVRL